MDMIIRIYFSFNLSYAYLCATDWKGRWIKVHMKANDSPQHLLSNTLLSLMKGCCVLSPRAIGSIITSLFWIPTSEVIKYLLLNKNRSVLANKSLEHHLPKGKEIQSTKSPPHSFLHIFPSVPNLERKDICMMYQGHLSPAGSVNRPWKRLHLELTCRTTSRTLKRSSH